MKKIKDMEYNKDYIIIWDVDLDASASPLKSNNISECTQKGLIYFQFSEDSTGDSIIILANRDITKKEAEELYNMRMELSSFEEIIEVDGM